MRYRQRRKCACEGRGFTALIESRSGTCFRGRVFAHDAMDRRIDPSWGGPIELFLVPASAPRLM